MTDLLVMGLSGAGLTVLTGVAIFTLSLKLSSAKDEREAARVLVASLTGELAAAKANLATQTNRADSERTRADALDTLISNAAGGVHTYDELLQKWRAARLGPADVTSTRAMPNPATAGSPRSDDLLRPGQD